MARVRIAASNVTTTLVIPRTLRAEVQSLTEKTGESFGEIVRVSLAAHLERQKQQEKESVAA